MLLKLVKQQSYIYLLIFVVLCHVALLTCYVQDLKNENSVCPNFNKSIEKIFVSFLSL